MYVLKIIKFQKHCVFSLVCHFISCQDSRFLSLRLVRKNSREDFEILITIQVAILKALRQLIKTTNFFV